jgi:DNA-binding IclR family transcriptional regulator
MTRKPNTAPGETKAATIIRLLTRKAGAELGALQEATGWQAHSVRAALSSLRKAGYTIDRTPLKAGGTGGAYRITAAPGDK